jgi:hypothetical protein
MRPFMPPKAAAEVAVLAFTEGAALPEEPPPVPAELLGELELQPAASKIDPTAATDATIAFDTCKVKPLPCQAPGVIGAKR